MSSSFAAGATVVRRDVLNGKVWTASPHRVVHDRDGELLVAHWPGIESLVPTTWIDWLHTGNEHARTQGIPNMASGRWELGHWTWRDTVVLKWFGVDPDFSIYFFRPVEDGGAGRWYINFERPPQRTPAGVDTFDLLLDLAVDQDFRCTWKDESEYAHGRRLGFITNTDHQRVSAARDRAISLIESRSGPLAVDWTGWRIPTTWPIPVLPSDILDHPGRSHDRRQLGRGATQRGRDDG